MKTNDKKNGCATRKYIEILSDNSALERLAQGKCVEGSIFRDKETGRLTFRAYDRSGKGRRKDRLVCETANGWLKESPQRYKFFCSQKKQLGGRLVRVEMTRELTQAMNTLDTLEIIDFI